MFSSGAFGVFASTTLAIFEGGTPTVIDSIIAALMSTLNAMGSQIVDIIKQALTTFAPILMTMSVVWLAINLYQRFTARAGR